MNEPRSLDSIANEVLHELATLIAAEVTTKLAQSQAHTLRPCLRNVDQAAVYLGRPARAVRHLIHQGLPTVWTRKMIRTGCQASVEA